MAQYLLHVHIIGTIQDDTEDVVTERMELNGFTRECKIGDICLRLAPWLYSGESTADEASVTNFLRGSLQEKISGRVHVFVLLAAPTQLACAPAWLSNTSVVFPNQH